MNWNVTIKTECLNGSEAKLSRNLFFLETSWFLFLFGEFGGCVLTFSHKAMSGPWPAWCLLIFCESLFLNRVEKVTVSILLVSPFLMGAQTSLAIWLTKGVAWGFGRKVSIAERVRTPSKIDFSPGNLGKLFRQEFVVIAVFYWDLSLEKESDLECLSSGSWGMAADPCSNPPLQYRTDEMARDLKHITWLNSPVLVLCSRQYHILLLLQVTNWNP